MHVIPLEMMNEGERGHVCTVEGTPELVIRLQEMGLREGVPVRMVRTGTPCILAVNDQRFSLRFDQRATVLVELTQ